MPEIAELKRIASQVRRDIIRMVHQCKSGHPGGSLGCADFLTALYFEILNTNTDFNMDGNGEDLFFLSNGHVSPLWYSVLARRGFFDTKELGTFRHINSRLQGHPATHEGIPGVRVASGSLGQGLSVAIGAALAKKLNKDDHMIYALTGDGELQEGQVWEAMMFAAAKKVDHLIVTVDWNDCQIDGSTHEVLDLGDLKAKFQAFGWIVLQMNGNIMDDVLFTLSEAKLKAKNGKPVVILMRTQMGFGVDYMMGTHKWHGNAPNDEQKDKALAQLEETLGDY
jgi:transketolase